MTFLCFPHYAYYIMVKIDGLVYIYDYIHNFLGTNHYTFYIFAVHLLYCKRRELL